MVFRNRNKMCKITIDTNIIDVEDYLDLRKSVNWGFCSKEDSKVGLENSLFMVTLRFENKIIGFGRVIGDGKIAFYIQDVIVIPEFQGKGHAKLIMDKIMEYIKSVATPKAVLGLMSATGVESFYKKYGFTSRPTGDMLGAGMTTWI